MKGRKKYILTVAVLSFLACKGGKDGAVNDKLQPTSATTETVTVRTGEETVADIYQREPQPSLDLVNRVTVKATDYTLRRIVNIRPEPVSSIYQNASYLFSEGNVERLSTDDGESQYIREDVTSPDILERMMANGYTMLDKFSVQPVRFTVDFSKITELFPYDTTSRIYKENTCRQGILIDPYNPEIVRISEELWTKSHQELISYARLCYEKAASMIRYSSKPMVSLRQILKERKGCCGDYASIFVSLLRARSIPARHVVAICPNNTYHVWAEFYMARYGWIPVDPTYRNSNPEGDYFGVCDGENIVVQRGLYLPVEVDPSTYLYAYPESLQQHYSRWWGIVLSPKGRVNIQQKHTFKKH